MQSVVEITVGGRRLFHLYVWFAAQFVWIEIFRSKHIFTFFNLPRYASKLIVTTYEIIFSW